MSARHAQLVDTDRLTELRVDQRPELRVDERPEPALVLQPTPAVRMPRDLTPEAPGTRRFRPDIQGLRAVAVLLVIAYHAGVPGVRGGYVGVDVFFVISGFLITGQLIREAERTGRISFGTFYANRVRRLLPPATIVLVVTLVTARLCGSLFQFRSIALDAVFTSVYGLNYRLAAQGVDYQQANGPVSPLQHLWSLGVEEQFYVVWPVLITLCALAGGRRWRRLLIAVAMVTVVVVSLYFSITITTPNPPLAYFSLHTRAWELGAGALVALIAGPLARQPRALSVAGGWIGLAAILYSGAVVTDQTPFPSYRALLPVLGSALVIVAGCRPSSRSVEGVLGRRPFQGIGAVSYAWYLWHWPLLILMPFIWGRDFAWWENAELMVIALWIATLTYWAVESPARRTPLRTMRWGLIGAGLNAGVAGLALLLIVTVPALVGPGTAAAALRLDTDDVRSVQRAVEAATQTREAPSNLDPSLGEVASDQPGSTKNGCHANYLVVSQGDCVYGDPHGRRTVVLTGDSHAQQWLPALDAAARAHGWKLVAWTKAACPMADLPVFSPALNRRYTECARWRARTIGRIELLAPDLILIGQSDAVPGDGTSNTEWAEATARTAAAFQRQQLPVGYLLDTPYHAHDVPDCVARNLADVGACTVKRARAVPYPGRAEQLTQTLHAAKIGVLDPTDWFCTAVDCPPIIGNMLVYRDAGHLTTAYSRYLAPMFSSLLVQQ